MASMSSARSMDYWLFAPEILSRRPARNPAPGVVGLHACLQRLKSLLWDWSICNFRPGILWIVIAGESSIFSQISGGLPAMAIGSNRQIVDSSGNPAHPEPVLIGHTQKCAIHWRGGQSSSRWKRRLALAGFKVQSTGKMANTTKVSHAVLLSPVVWLPALASCIDRLFNSHDRRWEDVDGTR